MKSLDFALYKILKGGTINNKIRGGDDEKDDTDETSTSKCVTTEFIKKEFNDLKNDVVKPESGKFVPFINNIINICITLSITAIISSTIMYNFLNSRKHWSTDEDLTFIDCIYFHFTTLSTVGYGDICAVSQEARIYTMALIILGLANVIGLGSFSNLSDIK